MDLVSTTLALIQLRKLPHNQIIRTKPNAYYILIRQILKTGKHQTLTRQHESLWKPG